MALTQKQLWLKGKCGAPKTDGSAFCHRTAGKDTDHPGEGYCKTHDPNQVMSHTRVSNKESGAGTLPVQSLPGKAIKKDLAILVGREMDVTPSEALMSCIRITAAEIMYFEMKISGLTNEQITWRPTKQELDRYGEKHEMKQQRELSIWVKERQKSVDRLAKYAKMALDVGIEAHKVRVAERYGEVISTALQRIFQRMGVDPRQNKLLPTIIREELAAIETQNYLRNPLVNPVGQLPQAQQTFGMTNSEVINEAIERNEINQMIHADREDS